MEKLGEKEKEVGEEKYLLKKEAEMRKKYEFAVEEFQRKLKEKTELADELKR